VLERWSPPQASSDDVFVAARGSIVLMSHRISRDAGATWRRRDPATGRFLAFDPIGDRSLAHLMPDGIATHAIEADGQPVLAADLRSAAFDEAGHAYVARGAPHVQIWRSTTPVR
jgi:hypothetical protein